VCEEAQGAEQNLWCNIPFCRASGVYNWDKAFMSMGQQSNREREAWRKARTIHDITLLRLVSYFWIEGSEKGVIYLKKDLEQKTGLLLVLVRCVSDPRPARTKWVLADHMMFPFYQPADLRCSLHSNYLSKSMELLPAASLDA
jgi:hypothetical protein